MCACSYLLFIMIHAGMLDRNSWSAHVYAANAHASYNSLLFLRDILEELFYSEYHVVKNGRKSYS